MMSASIPPAAATDVVHALLKVISDPGSANEKLQQLIKEGEAARAKWDEANTLLGRLANERSSWAKEREQTLAEIDAKMSEADQRLATADRREQALANADARLQAAEQRLAEMDLALASRQRMLDGVNATLAALHARIGSQEAS
jgi:chromosome segregation ATPase